MSLLIASGVDVNSCESTGFTPLHFAVCLEVEENTDESLHKKVIDALISAGADVNAANDSNGQTPLMAAILLLPKRESSTTRI
jgi:ankyrin repeat protein